MRSATTLARMAASAFIPRMPRSTAWNLEGVPVVVVALAGRVHRVSPVVLALGLLCLLAGLALLRRTHLCREQSGLPAGEIVYADTGDWQPCERPLFSEALHLSGRPDYIVRRRGELTPVEVKSTRGLARPLTNLTCCS